ncbi:MAG: translocation/assembly module TamB domain-containing protein, partial [Verrucomicrobiota bacterium]
AKTGSYVVTMEVENTLSDPHVSFHSTPELANAQIVRLLATGGTSSGGAGTVGLYLGKGLLGAGGMNGGLSDKLTVDVGEDVSREGKNTVGIRYDLGGDTYLKGEYDVYDAYNLDLVWSLFKQ